MNEIFVEQRSYRAEADCHHHDFHQILLPLRGELEIEIDGAGGRVEAARAAMIPATRRHAFRGLGGNRVLVLDLPVTEIEDDGVWERAQDDPFRAVDPAMADQILFMNRWLERGTASQAVTRRWSELMLALLTRAPSSRCGCPAAVLRALGFLDEAYPGRVSVQDVARAAHVSPSHLRALFRRHLGESVQQRLASIRLDAAQRLLAGGAHSVADVALAVGFSDQTALTRALRRERGITPAAYRRGLAE